MTHINNGAAAPAPALEYLVFTLGAEEYGIDIQRVQELRGYDVVTRIANAPAHIKGVVNLRGIVIPIMDMRIKFGVGVPAYDQFTVVIIINIAGRFTGVVVDSVADVITLAAEQVKPVPQHLGLASDIGYLVGVGTVEERMLLLMDIDQVLSDADLELVEGLATTSAPSAQFTLNP